jgi:hypothetical protein
MFHQTFFTKKIGDFPKDMMGSHLDRSVSWSQRQFMIKRGKLSETLEYPHPFMFQGQIKHAQSVG